MQGDETERMREAVRSLDETLKRVLFERAKAIALDRHRDLYALLAEHERREREPR